MCNHAGGGFAVIDDENESTPPVGTSNDLDGSMPPELSGPQWVIRFPCSVELEALASPFKENLTAFHSALVSAGATVTIDATRRPAERAFLMHYAFLIAKGRILPEQVPCNPLIDIIWVHETLEQSREAAQQMVDGYEIVYAPALHSKHIDGLAIDMTISWPGDLHICDRHGRVVVIRELPRSGENRALQALAKAYGVIKLLADPPHWSDDGH
jgi:hypothetical protein